MTVLIGPSFRHSAVEAQQGMLFTSQPSPNPDTCLNLGRPYGAGEGDFPPIVHVGTTLEIYIFHTSLGYSIIFFSSHCIPSSSRIHEYTSNFDLDLLFHLNHLCVCLLHL